MGELQTGIELAFAVFPQTPAFLKPSKGALDDPSLGNDRKGMQLIALGDLHSGPEFVFDGLGKRFARVAAIDEHTFDLA